MSNIDILFNAEEEREEKFQFKGHEIVVKVKELGWSEKNKILSKCFEYQTDGHISFAFDVYNREMLKKIISSISVDGSPVPKVEIGDIFFTKLNVTFGSILEKLVPKAFEEVQINDFFGKESGS